MGHPCDFFMASDEQLATAFPGWVAPTETPTPVEIDYGLDEPITEISWHPDAKPAGSVLYDPIAGPTPLPHDPVGYLDLEPVVMANWWTHGNIAVLFAVACDVPLAEAESRAARPALVEGQPPHVEAWLHKLPSALQVALSQADASTLSRWATEWPAADGNLNTVPEAIVEVLTEVAQLCGRAEKEGRSVYYFTSL